MPLPGIVLVALVALLALPATASAQTPLTAERFAAIDAVFTAALDFGLAVPASEAAYDAARASCRGLDSADPLLGPYRKSCTAGVQFARVLDAGASCRSRASCLRNARRSRLAATEFLRRDRAADAAIEAAMLVPGCADALRTDAVTRRSVERARDLLALIERTIRTGSERLRSRSRREARAIDRAAAKGPSAKRLRKNFRDACAPAAAPA